jgi:hypothetical protein
MVPCAKFNSGLETGSEAEPAGMVDGGALVGAIVAGALNVPLWIYFVACSSFWR